MLCYKNEIQLDTRISECNRINSKYIDRIPIIVDYNKELIPFNLKRKFLVPYEVSASYLLSIIRNKCKIYSKKALFMFCNNKLLSSGTMMYEIYENYKNEMIKDEDFRKGDKFLYIKITTEITFG